MAQRVLLSIHPEYAEAILRGEKKYEFRRVPFRRPVSEILLYETSPVCLITGSFQVSDICTGTPEDIWRKTKEYSGISRQRFAAYFGERKTAFAILVSTPVRFAVPLALRDMLPSGRPPQSFCYLPEG